MKQRIKRALLMLCMFASFLVLSACSNAAETEAESIDAQTSAYLCQVNESLLQQIATFDEETAVIAQEQLTKEKQNVLAGGLASWVNVMNDTGTYDSIISSEAGVNEDGEYYCTTLAKFADRNVEFKVFWSLSEQTMEPISISIAPEYTLGENMSRAAMNTLLGMGTVFGVLIFICLLIYCFKFISVFENKMKKTPEAVPVPVSTPAVAVEEEEEELVDDLELVAVITAAIAAATNSSTDGLVVRSIKRAPGAKWKRA